VIIFFFTPLVDLLGLITPARVLGSGHVELVPPDGQPALAGLERPLNCIAKKGKPLPSRAKRISAKSISVHRKELHLSM
jgi:hypothetical protein